MSVVLKRSLDMDIEVSLAHTPQARSRNTGIRQVLLKTLHHHMGIIRVIKKWPPEWYLPMGFHVLFAIEWGLKCFLAIGTHIGTQVVMDAHMPPQAPTSGESSVTHQTLERFQSSVCSDVCFEHSCRNKASSTLRTFKRLFACVWSRKNEHCNEWARSDTLTTSLTPSALLPCITSLHPHFLVS